MNRRQRITATAVLLPASLAVPGVLDDGDKAFRLAEANLVSVQQVQTDVTPSPGRTPSQRAGKAEQSARDASSDDTAAPARKAKTSLADAESAQPGSPSGPAGAAPDERAASGERDTTPDNGETEDASMSAGVPEGFRAQTQPQETLIEVYFGDRLITTAMAEFTPDTIEFLEPGKVVEALSGVRKTDKLEAHLRGPMPTHGSRVCRRPEQDNCGTLEPDKVGVIFDDRRFRADLFLHPDFLVKQDSDASPYLAEPDTPGVGLVQNLSANYSGTSLGQDQFSLFGRTRAGHGTSHLFSNWVSTNEQDMSVRELGFRKDFRAHQVSVGLYQPRNQLLTALRRNPLAGIGIERTFNRRSNQALMSATDVEIALNSRARVELLREGRLHDVRFYPAGRHQIDTARLPTGAYNLQIRITESNGSTRTLERFFVKSQRLAPGGEKLWFAQLGQAYRRDGTRLWPRDTGTLMARSGVQYRQRDNLGLGLAGAAVEGSGLGEFSANWLTPELQAQGSVFASTEGSSGWLLRASASRGDWRLIVDSERIQAEADARTDFTLLPDSVERERLEVRAPIVGGQTFASWQRLQRNDNGARRTARLGYTRTFRVGGHQTLNLNTSVSRSDGTHAARLSLDWRFTTTRWQHQARLTQRDSQRAGADDGTSARASTSWRDGDRLHDDLQVTAGVEADEQARQASLDGQYTWQYGRARAGLSYTQQEAGQDRRVSSATYDTNLVARSGDAAVGGPELNQAGLIIDLRGAPGALFDILVDGKKRFVARGGQRAAIALRAYDEYEITIQDRGTDFVHYDHDSRHVTLYPGNVKTLHWDLERVMIVLGVLETPAGKPLGDAVIKGTRGMTRSDPNGYFQGEIRGQDAKLFARTGDTRCRLDTGPIEPENGVARLGHVPCRPVEDPPSAEGVGASP